ncbi:MAG: dihydrodipicolinate reductase C-terminal domain-containing protein [Pseudomonadota bacterium]
MKIAIVGKGKTGQSIINCLHKEQISGIYSSQQPATASELNKADVVIVFVPASVFLETDLWSALLESQKPVVCGTTGLSWDEKRQQQIKQNNSIWIVADNFSLLMVLIHRCLKELGTAKSLIEDCRFSIEETHHLHKVDLPSGTALSWQSSLGVEPCPIQSYRKGDVKGQHTLSLETPFEKLTLVHEVHDRRLFAKGAIWAAQSLLEHQSRFATGCYQFNNWVEKVT